MNENGHPETLIGSHPANQNAVKAGVYSERVRRAKEDETRQRLRTLPADQMATEELFEEHVRLRALRDLLDADLKKYGVSNRRGDARRQVGQRLRLADKIERSISQMRAELERVPDGEPEADAGSDEARLARFSELRAMAFGECSDVSCRDQIAAIKELASMPAPPRPNPAAALTDEELDAEIKAWIDGETLCEDAGSTQVDDEVTAPASSELSDRDRCIAELHKIAIGRRHSARPRDRIDAIRLLRTWCPSTRDVIREELAGMSQDEVDAKVREEYEWWLEFEANDPEQPTPGA